MKLSIFVIIHLWNQLGLFSCEKNLRNPMIHPTPISLSQRILVQTEEFPYMKNIQLYKFSKTFTPLEIEKIHQIFHSIRMLVNTTEFLQAIEEKFSQITHIPIHFQDIHPHFKHINPTDVYPFLEKLKTDHINLLVCRMGSWDIKTYNNEDIIWIGKSVDVLQEKDTPTLLLQLFSGTLHQIKASPLDEWIIFNLAEILTTIFISHKESELIKTILHSKMIQSKKGC